MLRASCSLPSRARSTTASIRCGGSALRHVPREWPFLTGPTMMLPSASTSSSAETNMAARLPRLSLAFVISCSLAGAASAADEVQIQPDIVYGHKDGMALTMDVLRPSAPSGAAVLYLQSGGW